MPRSSLPNSPLPHKVALVLFPQMQLLDVAGPADVFQLANEFGAKPRYEVMAVSSQSGLQTSSCGLALLAQPISQIKVKSLGTVILAGAGKEGVRHAVKDDVLRDWVTKAHAAKVRLASVCSGAFALAAWGLLDQRRATTHWSATQLLHKNFSRIQVEPEALYVQDESIWTSGGVTTGIDMCLAMVEADHGRALAMRVAKQLVLSARRVGNQSQYSAQLAAQSGRYAELIAWMEAHLRQDLDIPSLAHRASETQRSFCRHFANETGYTPAAFVELMRVQRAKEQLEAGVPLKKVARAMGFSSDEHMARAFKRRLDMTAAEYQRGFQI
jgi:transcriptional regulator GlxA family with amidase domain